MINILTLILLSLIFSLISIKLFPFTPKSNIKKGKDIYSNLKRLKNN